MRRSALVLVLFAGSVAATACGNLTAGGASEVEVVVASDESEGAAASEAGVGSPATTADAPDRASSSDHLDAPLLQTGLPLEGTIRLGLSVILVDVDGREQLLTDGAQEVMMDLAAGSRAHVAVTEVPPGDYQGFRAVFTKMEAEVESGPGSAPFPGVVELDVSAGPLQIERTRPFSLGDDGRARVVVDLRSSAWIVAPGLLAPAVFRNAVRIEIEQD